MRLLLAACAATAACALLPAPSPASAEPVRGGVVDPFRGIAGIHIGMREAVVRRVLGRPDVRNAQDVSSYGDLTIDMERGRVWEVSSTGVRFCTVGGLCVGEPGARAALRREGVRTTLVIGSAGGPFLHACRRMGPRRVVFQAPVEPGRRLRANQFVVRDAGRRCPTRGRLVESGR